jgi:membrane fusion protein, copper/silver efflux system
MSDDTRQLNDAPPPPGAALPPGQEASPPSPTPPHGPRLRILLPVAILVAAALAIGVIWSGPLKSAADRAATALFSPTATKSGQGGEAKTQYYTCGMHPQVMLPKPGKCPICQMELVPIDPKKFTPEKGITISPIMTQSIGVRIAPVTTGPVTGIVRTVGTVDYDETRVRDVNLKISGWVEKLHVNETGQAVEKDQPLLDIYSPDLYSAQEEYLLAFKRAEALKAAAPQAASDAASMNTGLLAAVRKRLEYYDISDTQIRLLEQSGKAAKAMTVRSPFSGTVVVKNVVEGQKVDAGVQLMRIADLSKVWIMVTIYEYQIPFVEVGQKAVVSLPYAKGRTFEGKVTYVYPTVSQDLRQARARVELDNPDGLLKPGMFAGVELRRTLAADRTLVPREAVIDTGTRQIAFVSLGAGRFEPRDVRVGPVEAEGGMVEIEQGLKPGEMVVTSGEFLLDSEGRIREDLAKLIKGDLAAEQKPEPDEHGAAAAPATPTAGTPAGRFINPRCPIMNTPIDAANVPDTLIREYKGHKVAFCCPGCPDQWDKLSDAEKDRRLIKAGVPAALLEAPAKPGAAPTVPEAAPAAPAAPAGKPAAMPPMPGMPGMSAMPPLPEI